MEPTRAPWAREGPNHLDVQPPRISTSSDMAEDTADPGMQSAPAVGRACWKRLSRINADAAQQHVHHQGISKCRAAAYSHFSRLAAAMSHRHRKRGYLTGQPVESVVVAEARLPVPLAASGRQGTSFQPPEKRIHNQADLDRHDTGHLATLPSHRGNGSCHSDRFGSSYQDPAAEESPCMPSCSAISEHLQDSLTQQFANKLGRRRHVASNRFLGSAAVKEFVGFIHALNDAVKGRSNGEACSMSAPLEALVDVLQQMSAWVDDIPPQQQSLRYGNPAYRYFSGPRHTSSGIHSPKPHQMQIESAFRRALACCPLAGMTGFCSVRWQAPPRHPASSSTYAGCDL